MKTYIEINQPSAISLLTIHMDNLKSSIQSLCGKLKSQSWKKSLALLSLLLAIIALSLGCSLFALITVALFIIFLGILINEFIQYIRLIREME